AVVVDCEPHAAGQQRAEAGRFPDGRQARLLQRPQTDLPRCREAMLHGAAQQAALQAERRRGESRPLQPQPAFPLRLHQIRPGPRRQVVQQRLVGRDEVRKLAQPRPNARAKIGQNRQQLAAHAVAEIGRILIGVVENGLQVVVAAVCLDRGARDAQQRPYQHPRRVSRQGCDGPHAAQPRQARSAQQVHQHRFRLVIGVV
ncbi:hypothetical protein RZS08_05935, partial [Arthrospira platensis SPKY1]|nr:hypothetical protein [Arthrospira platensis SPKY1]